MALVAKSGVKSATVEARLIKADGTVIDLGVIASSEKKSLCKKFVKWIKKIF